MEIREPRSVEEYRAGEAVIAAAWRAAFDDIVTDDALERVDEQPEKPALDDRFRRLQASDDAVSLVARTDEEVVGTASIAWGPDRMKGFAEPTDAELVTLYVAPDAWGNGIGTALLATAVDQVPDSTDRIVLETFRANEIGRQFYEARGFEQVDTWTFEIADRRYPTIVYARPL